jgi:segregation and condensation protein B
MANWIGKLWEEKPKRYSRAVLETIALIAYRQPITRGDIEQIRGVAVSSDIVKGLLERDWIKVVGHRDVPGRPAMYATTKEFLDYFNLKSLEQLPTLAEIKDLDSLNSELNLEDSFPPIKASLELTEDDLSEESVNKKVQEEHVVARASEDADSFDEELDDDYNDDDIDDLVSNDDIDDSASDEGNVEDESEESSKID